MMLSDPRASLLQQRKEKEKMKLYFLEMMKVMNAMEEDDWKPGDCSHCPYTECHEQCKGDE